MPPPDGSCQIFLPHLAFGSAWGPSKSVTRQGLTVGAKVGTATGDFGLDDGGAAAAAGLTVPVENLCKKFKIVTLGTVGFHIGGHSGAAGSDGFVHDVAGRFEELRGFLLGNGTAFSLRVNLGSKESLVGINIAEPCNNSLV